MMSRTSLALFAVACAVWPQHALAQDASRQTVSLQVTALMVEITISRYQGDKRLSSIPYTLAVTPERTNSSNLRVGGEIPVPMATVTPAKSDDPAAKPLRSIGYRSIGTNIDVSAAAAADGRYRISIALEESSVYPADEVRNSIMSGSSPSGAPAFRSMRTSNTVLLKDGQSIEFIAATDRISGEVARVSVTLTVVP